MNTEGFLADYKKEGKRKTKESIQRRLTKLEDKWKKFHENHLRLEQNLSPGDEYLTKDYYGATKEVYLEAKSLMEKYLKELAPGETIRLESHPRISSSSSEDEDEEQGQTPKRGDEIYTGAYPKWPDNPLHDFPTALPHKEQHPTDPLRPWDFFGSQNISGRDEVLRGGLNYNPQLGTEMANGDRSEMHAPPFNIRSENHTRNEFPTSKQIFEGDRSREDAPPQINMGQPAGPQGPGYYFIPCGPQHSDRSQILHRSTHRSIVHTRLRDEDCNP